VQLVTVCADEPAAIRKGRARHGANAVMLSDPELVVTDLYNLRNARNVSPKGIAPLPIPTTFLVDAAGRVRWIDQTDDYQLRSAPERVRAALEEGLG